MTSAGQARRAWARALIRRAPDAPAYGTPEWVALPDGPEKVAAVVRAAEAWALDDDDFELRLEAELRAARARAKAAEDAAWRARKVAHAAAWTGTGFRPDPTLQADLEAEWLEWVGGGAA